MISSRQKHRSWQLYSNEKNGLQQIQMESCQQIKRLRDKEKKTNYIGHQSIYRLNLDDSRYSSVYFSWILKEPV